MRLTQGWWGEATWTSEPVILTAELLWNSSETQELIPFLLVLKLITCMLIATDNHLASVWGEPVWEWNQHRTKGWSETEPWQHYLNPWIQLCVKLEHFSSTRQWTLFFCLSWFKFVFYLLHATNTNKNTLINYNILRLLSLALGLKLHRWPLASFMTCRRSQIVKWCPFVHSSILGSIKYIWEGK